MEAVGHVLEEKRVRAPRGVSQGWLARKTILNFVAIRAKMPLGHGGVVPPSSASLRFPALWTGFVTEASSQLVTTTPVNTCATPFSARLIPHPHPLVSLLAQHIPFSCCPLSDALEMSRA